MSSLLLLPSPSPSPKLHLTTFPLLPYTDPSQPPTKRSPFRQIHSTSFIRSISLILPDDLYNRLITKFDSTLLKPRYAKVFMSLIDILTGNFFTHYIKPPGSDILMLSEGTPGVDDRFELCEGSLRMELCKETYEKCGLQGQVVRGGGRKHVKARWEVEVNLRQGRMVKGKKGFERVLWAARNVLGRGMCWLVVDVGGKGGEKEGQGQGQGKGEMEDVLGKWNLTWVDVELEERVMEDVMVPEGMLKAESGVATWDEDEWYEIMEWLDMVALGCEGVVAEHSIDSYISRYEVPGGERAKREKLRVITWSGLLSSSWLTRLLIEIIKHSRVAKTDQWVSISVSSHLTHAVGQVNGYNIILQPDAVASQVPDQDDPDAVMTDATQRQDSLGFQRAICAQFVDSTTAG